MLITKFNAQTPSPALQQPVAAPDAYLFKPLSQPEADTVTPAIFRHPITVGRNIRRPDELEVRDIAYVMEAIKTGYYEGYNLKKAIETIRKTSNKEAARNAKSKLPWFSPSLFKGKRANENFLRSRFMVFDIDHVGTGLPARGAAEICSAEAAEQPVTAISDRIGAHPTQIDLLKEIALAKLPYIRYAFRSVNDGVKLVAQFTRDITNERDYCKIYMFLAMQIEWALKKICDNTHDPARACFFSYDPELLTNHNPKPLDPQDTYKQAISVMDIPWPKGEECRRLAGDVEASSRRLKEKPQDVASTPANLLPSSDDYAKAEKVVAVLSQITIAYQDWIKIGMALRAGFGESGKTLWDRFLNNPNYQDTQRIIDTAWRSFSGVRSITLASLFYIAEKYGVSYE